MPVYKYKALADDGAKVSGSVAALSRSEAVGKVRQEFSAITECRRTVSLPLSAKTIAVRRPSDKALALLCGRISIILQSGLPVVRAIELACAQTADRVQRGMLHAVATNLSAGMGLATSFAASAAWIPAVFTEAVRAGEESGTLAGAFAKLSAYFEKNARTKAKVRNALMYPALLCATAVIVSVVVLTQLVPALAGTLFSLGGELPLVTRVLIAVSDFFVKHGVVVAAAIAALAAACVAMRAVQRERFSRLAIKLPIFGKIIAAQSAGQFAGALATMLSSGMPLTRALSATSRAVANRYVGAETAKMVAGVESGRRLGECMAGNKAFPEMLVEMIFAGEDSGELESTLEVAASYYEAEVASRTERALALFEPAMIVFAAVCVLFVVLAVYMPMMEMYGRM